MPSAVRDLELDLDAFEGPFDLLLTLILKDQLEPAEIDIASIVVAFVEHLTARDRIDLDACGEFLVLIAALLEIKARQLFPEEDAELSELEPEEAAEELARRLAEYRRMKEAAGWLAERLSSERDRFFRVGPAPLAPQLMRQARRAVGDSRYLDALMAIGPAAVAIAPELRAAMLEQPAHRTEFLIARSVIAPEDADGLNEAAMLIGMSLRWTGDRCGLSLMSSSSRRAKNVARVADAAPQGLVGHLRVAVAWSGGEPGFVALDVGSADVGEAADFGVVVDQVAGEDAERGVLPGDRVRPQPQRHLVQVVGQRRCQLGCTIGDPGPVGGSPSVAAVVPGRD